MVITEEHLNRVNIENHFDKNKVNCRNGATIDESLISINVDEQSVDRTITVDPNLHPNIVETSPIVDTQCTPINCLFQNSEKEEISKQLYELIECWSTSEITSSSDRNQCSNVTTAESFRCTAVQQMLLKDLKLMVQKFYEFSHSERRKTADCQSDIPTEAELLSRVDNQNAECLSISAKSSDNLTEEYNSTEAEKVTPAYFDILQYAIQISEDKLRPDNDYNYSIKDVGTCSNINRANQSSKITSRNKKSMYLKTYFTRKKIQTMKKALRANQKSNKMYCRHKNNKEKTIVTHTKRKTIGAFISKNNLPRKLRFKKKPIDIASKPVSTIENDKNISNCDEITNNESELSKPSTEGAKVEDIVKNSSDSLEKLNPANKDHSEDKINDNESSEVTIANIPVANNTKKGMHEEIKQLLVFIDKNILIVDPVDGVSINPNPSSHLNTSNLVNSGEQADAMLQLESDKTFYKTTDHLTMNKNDTDNTLKNAKMPRKLKQPMRRTTQNKGKKVNIIQKRPAVKKSNSANRKSMLQLKQFKIVRERYPVNIYNKNTQKNNSTKQEEHCDSTTAVIENSQEIGSLLETSDSQEIETYNTDAEYFKSFPLFYSESADRQIIKDWRSKKGVETNINDIIDSEIICVEENSTSKVSVTEILNSNFR